MRIATLVTSGLIAGTAGVTAQEPDFSTPRATVGTLLEAIERGDADLLAQCFSPNAEGEFEVILTKQLTDAQWRELREMFTGAVIGEPRMGDDANRATVSVQLTDGREDLYMVREDGYWRILGF